MKRLHRGMLWAALAAAAAAGLVWAFMPQAVGVETAVARQGAFEQSIEEDGRTEIRDRYLVSTPLAGRLVRLVLREGDAVRAGQVVAQLRPVLPPMHDERTLREAQARLQAADAALSVAQARLARSEAALAQADRQLARSERLAREGFVSGAALDTERLAAQAAARELDAARGQARVAMHERAQAAIAVDPTGGAPGEAWATSARAIALRAPADGQVLSLTQTSEATLPAGAAVMALGDPSGLEVVVELLTTDAMRTQPGARAVIEGWGGPPVPARVRQIDPAASTKISALGVEEQRVKVRLTVDAPPTAWQRLGDGFRVTVRIVTLEAAEALLVPSGAVFPRPEGGYAVYRIVEGRARLQAVEVSARNEAEVWIRSGLHAGDPVVIYPPVTLLEGGRVQVRRP